MAFWAAYVPFKGTATIVLKSDTKPTIDDFRVLLHRDEINEGLPQFFTMGAEIEEIKEDFYNTIRRNLRRKAAVSKIASEILKQAGDYQRRVKMTALGLTVDILTQSDPHEDIITIALASPSFDVQYSMDATGKTESEIDGIQFKMLKSIESLLIKADIDLDKELKRNGFKRN